MQPSDHVQLRTVFLVLRFAFRAQQFSFEVRFRQIPCLRSTASSARLAFVRSVASECPTLFNFSLQDPIASLQNLLRLSP